jgi:peptidoglycan hydrolase-like protein with peptidoglycan-binding domain
MLRKTLLVFSITLSFAIAAFAQGPAASNSTSTASSTSDSTKKKTAVFRPTKDQIIQVQIKLKEKKLYTGDASGQYNDETRTGIKSFQKSNGLKETGTLNRATLEKFEVELTAPQKLIPVSESSLASKEPEKTKESTAKETSKSRAPIFRATEEQIKAAQKMLKGKSMYTGEESGKLNNDTRTGIKKYQDENGVKVTGTLNAATLEKMGIPLTDKQKADSATPAKAGN